METHSEVFRTQAFHCRGLGSPFNADLCELLADRLDETTAVGRHVIGWPGEASYRADAVPLRLCGALHALVLTGQDADLAAHYPPQSDVVPDWALLNDVLVRHEAFILNWMVSPPQTNEVARSNMIMSGLLVVADLFERPMRLLEIGASGGLNLQMDRFDFVLGGQNFGPDSSELLLAPEWTGPPPPASHLVVESRGGCDINPLDPTSDQDALRLRAYLWPDQKDRVERLNHAMDYARAYPVMVQKTDAISFMENELANLQTGVTTVFYSTVAWQYLTDADKAKGESLMAQAGALATQESPLVWLRFEGDGQQPGGAISLKAWSGGEPLDVVLGRADFHGRWVDWNGLPA
ncbi:MAG: DUF2332 family protein [Pseudomonadota bacterium]